MNPFEEKPKQLDKFLSNWQGLYPKSYKKCETDPYTKTRIILMNGTEFESNWFSHCFLRHTDDLTLRQKLSKTRFLEKQQQQSLSMLKPLDETILEQTIGYEQLAVDLTAELAKHEKDKCVKNALDFALLEDFDHLYRYANLLENDDGIHAETLVGKYTEIMPARPTLAHHRYPVDNPKKPICDKKADKETVMHTMIITAAEQQTMNYYMNAGCFYRNDAGRKLYEEICLVEEEHVTQYGSLMDPNASWFEMLLWHEYVECYLYWSCYMTEKDDLIRPVWEMNLENEIAQLHEAVALLNEYEKKDACCVIKDGKFPEPLSLHENVEYVRDIIKNTAQFTLDGNDYKPLDELDKKHRFFVYQNVVNNPVKEVPSHDVIVQHQKKYGGTDYRFETAENPIEILRDRTTDSVEVGVVPSVAPHGKL